MQPAIQVHWAQLPGMYTLSGLGQEIPMTLPPWYANTLTYAAATALLLPFALRYPPRLSPA
jgi:hypothetical protein